VEAVEAHPEVRAAAPYADVQGLLMFRGKALPALVHGIDPDSEQRISVIGSYASAGSLAQLSGDAPAVVLSASVAATLGAQVGEHVLLLVPELNARGQLLPRTQRVLVAGTFSTGTEVDNLLTLTSLGLASRLRGSPGTAQGVRFQVRDLFAAPRIRLEVEQGLGPRFRGFDWTRTHGNLHEAIRMSRNLVGVLLFLIVAVAAFNVVSTLFLIVKDKQGDIAILRTLGASPATIMAVFVIQGSLIGLAGTVVGGAVGAGLSLVITDAVDAVERAFGVRFLDAAVYPVSYLPSDLSFANVALVCSVAFAMSFLATVYPSWRAARMQPAEILRHE
jgi:lipoprotein-releasing system permease protein